MPVKPPLLLLHGAMAEKNQFEFFIRKLHDSFDVHAINFEGHGDFKETNRPFRIKYFVENVQQYLEEQQIVKAKIFGYSMGGYAALVLAMKQPEKVEKIATLGTILQWNEKKADQECLFLNKEKIIKKVPHFAQALERQHQCGWKVMVDKTREMLQYLGKNPEITEEDWENLTTPVRFHIGDGDTLAGVEPTVNVFRRVKNAELCVIPNTPHSFEKADQEKLTKSMVEFFLKAKKITN